MIDMRPAGNQSLLIAISFSFFSARRESPAGYFIPYEAINARKGQSRRLFLKIDGLDFR
jgi:hypothetical protein